MFSYQNKELQQKLLQGGEATSQVGVSIDIESELMVRPRKAGGKIEERQLTQYEIECLERFQANDEAIDEMLGVVITQLERINLQAENINKELGA